jgi:hypothetical protein
MKRIQALLLLFASPWLFAEVPEPKADDPADVAFPTIEVTKGYGAAKWGMSPGDFEKLYPEAKKHRDVADNIGTQQAAQKLYSVGNDSLMIQFMFLRDKLVRIVLKTIPTISPDPDHRLPSRNLKPLERRIEERFVVQKDSGVVVHAQFSYSPFMSHGGPNMPPRLSGGMPPHVQALPPPGGAPGPSAAPPPIPRSPQQSPPILEISLYQSKLTDSLEGEFTKEVSAGQDKAVGDLITKLAPPK